MMKYDYLVVGAGLFGATFANLAHRDGKSVLVIDKRDNVAGNVFSEEIEGIQVHKFGAHIFHTDDEKVWDYVNSFAKFDNFINSPIARIDGETYNLPFNMNTFTKIWDDVVTPDDALKRISAEKNEVSKITNCEEQAISLVGKTIYEKLIKGYTEKQWGRPCAQLPAFIIKRLPVRFTFDNNYFSDKYQGIPHDGYTRMVEAMLDGIDVRLGQDFFENREGFMNIANKVVYTGAIDEFFDYCLGKLEWRSLRFETKIVDASNFQGNAVVNYTGLEVPYTRVIEHKFFRPFIETKKTVISYEYPMEYADGVEKYYSINDEKNNVLARKYTELAKASGVIFGGRLAEYKYYDMDDVIKSAFETYNANKK